MLAGEAMNSEKNKREGEIESVDNFVYNLFKKSDILLIFDELR